LAGKIDFIVDDPHTVLPELLATVSSAGVTISSVEIKEPDLESVFLTLTGRALRD
jgi:ABC-2 type transport system ATP-binding protein